VRGEIPNHRLSHRLYDPAGVLRAPVTPVDLARPTTKEEKRERS